MDFCAWLWLSTVTTALVAGGLKNAVAYFVLRVTPTSSLLRVGKRGESAITTIGVDLNRDAK